MVRFVSKWLTGPPLPTPCLFQTSYNVGRWSAHIYSKSITFLKPTLRRLHFFSLGKKSFKKLSGILVAFEQSAKDNQSRWVSLQFFKVFQGKSQFNSCLSLQKLICLYYYDTHISSILTWNAMYITWCFTILSYPCIFFSQGSTQMWNGHLKVVSLTL